MEEKFIYLYKAHFYDEDLNVKEEGGMLVATSYTDAFEQIAAYYADDLIDIFVESVDSYYPLTFHLDNYETIKKIAEEASV